MRFRIFTLLVLLAQVGFSQEKVEKQAESEEIRINQFIEGTLLTPASEEKPPLVVLIQGSGPTDRNGNQPFMKNDSFKKLANALALEGIASFRYDKRISEMERLGMTEAEIRFDHFITDASSVLQHFEDKEQFGGLVVLGHSQGSLVGMVAAKNTADAFISVSGAGQPIDSVLVTQIGAQMPGLKENARSSFKELREKGSTESYNPMLASLFRPQIQSFMLSWMRYNPAEEIAELEMPVLIIGGTKDLQVSQEEAALLKAANPDATLMNLENMNHILRKIEGDALENQKSYNEPNRTLHPQLLPTIAGFIKKLE